ncbi:hypothetical protein Sjap_007105 [Stephania japonica]|uniref:Uncharacterized protein n=1 Tax=Stephania japonica TaxID=461633 RepID=A0AAP0PD73_9MAGN
MTQQIINSTNGICMAVVMASLATKAVEGGDEVHPHCQEHPSLHQQYFHHYSGLHLSRLSMCTKGETTTHIDIDDADDKHYDGDDDYDDDQDDDHNEEDGGASNITIACNNAAGDDNLQIMSRDSDHKEAAKTPRWRWRRRRRGGLKEYYASENEAQQQKGNNKDIMKRRERGVIVGGRAAAGIVTRYSDDDNNNHLIINNRMSTGGESECFVITRPKGGRRTLCMDLEEVKACRELGFELDQISLMSMSPTYSTVDYTSSGGNSPIASWGRISSPGDDPRDVKARLKTWAQMVALATATR